MATGKERIPNRGRGGLPAWGRTGPLLVSLLFALLAVLYLLQPPPPAGVGLLPWMYIASAAIWAFIAWDLTVSWIEVDEDRLRVRFGFHAKTFPMTEIVGVAAYRRWLRWRSRRWAENYEIRLIGAHARQWGFGRVLPPAADRLMASLYRHEKPIMVYTWL